MIIENVPDELLDRLRRQADASERSLSQQVLHVLEKGLDREEKGRVDAEAQMRQWERLAGRWKSDENTEEEISAIYAARSSGREVTL